MVTSHRPNALFIASLAVPVLLSGCVPPVPAAMEPAGTLRTFCCTRGEEGLTLQYLGVGGWLFRFGQSALLTAPFFSNPSLLDVGMAGLAPDSTRIDRFLPPVTDVSAVLVGHAHYDHLMDVPYILRRHAPHARLYGNRTAVNLVAGDPGIDPNRLHDVESLAGSPEHPGEWVYLPGHRVRFMALESGHAPHLFGLHFYRGERDTPAERLPRAAGEWVEGRPLAFLIDFLGPDGEVAFRVHYQDAASEAPEGFPPPLEDGVPVDLAIVCPPGFQHVDGYPEGILTHLNPSLVLLGHWEDFFRPRSEPARPVATLDLDAFLTRMQRVLPDGAESALPEPGTTFRVVAGG